jgi:serine/threonine protein kinase
MLLPVNIDPSAKMPGHVAGESRKTQIVQRFSRWLSKTFSRSGDLKEEDETPYTLSNGAWVEKVDRIDRYYKVLKTLGEGEFGQVKLVQCLETNKQVRVTFVRCADIICRWP